MKTKTKVLAFYLPQFHRIPENDLWWGEGFTEWTNTKKAVPLFKGHNQPRIPYNENYYDLSTVEEMYSQAKMAKEYGISGFCYYHYWFKGKKLLHKPLENMLTDKKVDIDFCLSWANEPWTRAWDGGDKEILMAQDYGDTEDWDAHIAYLIPYFRDDRYIKVDGKPMFLIYRTESFLQFDDMIEYWNKKLLSIGMKELYIVETLNAFQVEPTCKLSSAVLEFEPMFTITNDFTMIEQIYRRFKRKYITGGPLKIDYSDIWGRMLKRKYNLKYKDKRNFSGAFVDWDNTARKGEKGLIVTNSSPDLFRKYLKKMAETKKIDFLFMNAWNEWCEGTYLEPDTKNGNDYLEAIKDVFMKNNDSSKSF